MLHEVKLQAATFDVLHFHTDLLHFPMFEDRAQQTITTLHGRLDIAGVRGALGRWPQFGLVSISAKQRDPIPEANLLATVQHGLAPELYRPPRSPSGAHTWGRNVRAPGSLVAGA